MRPEEFKFSKKTLNFMHPNAQGAKKENIPFTSMTFLAHCIAFFSQGQATASPALIKLLSKWPIWTCYTLCCATYWLS